MEMTSSKCRAQEAIQRDRAANASLENVRIVAQRAAIAWAQEAIEAERREDPTDRYDLDRLIASAV